MFLQRFIVIVFLGLLTGVTSQGVPGVKLSKRQGLCQAGYAACPQASDFCCPETKPYCVVDTETETVSCVPLVYCTSDTVACPMNVGYCCGLAEICVVDKNGDVGCYDGTTTVAATPSPDSSGIPYITTLTKFQPLLPQIHLHVQVRVLE
jgi:hypothetical protein